MGLTLIPAHYLGALSITIRVIILFKKQFTNISELKYNSLIQFTNTIPTTSFGSRASPLFYAMK